MTPNYAWKVLCNTSWIIFVLLASPVQSSDPFCVTKSSERCDGVLHEIKEWPGTLQLSGLRLAFADMDGDGDFDAFGSANSNSNIKYFENVGSATNPSFELRTGDENPMSKNTIYGNQNPGLYAQPALVDIDNDGDADMFVGVDDRDEQAYVWYFENTGTKNVPVFTERSGADNLIKSSDLNSGLTGPTLGDIDGDSDFDLFVSDRTGKTLFFENTGTLTSPVFTKRTGAQNPMNSINTRTYTSPVLVDIDSDGDLDVFFGLEVRLFINILHAREMHY